MTLFFVPLFATKCKYGYFFDIFLTEFLPFGCQARIFCLGTDPKSVLLEQYEKETTQIQDNVYLENSVNSHDMEKSLQIRNSTDEFLIFVLDGKKDGVQVMYTDETIWLTQDAIAVLFDKGRTTIVEHLKNIFNEGELDRDSVCRKFRHTASDGHV